MFVHGKTKASGLPEVIMNSRIVEIGFSDEFFIDAYIV
jgi:hypothetical protein